MLNESNNPGREAEPIMTPPILQLRKVKFREVEYFPQVTQLLSGEAELVKDKPANCEHRTL